MLTDKPVFNVIELMPASRATVIFRGNPSQVVNLAAWVRCFGWTCSAWIAAVVLSTHTPYPGTAILAAGVATALYSARAVYLYVRTSFIEIIIDIERLTCRQGIFNREVTSLELFRIQDVVSRHPWWQRVFNVGTVLVMTSDSNAPVWRLPGLRNAEALRDELNRASIALRDRKGYREINMGYL